MMHEASPRTHRASRTLRAPSPFPPPPRPTLSSSRKRRTWGDKGQVSRASDRPRWEHRQSKRRACQGLSVLASLPIRQPRLPHPHPRACAVSHRVWSRRECRAARRASFTTYLPPPARPRSATTPLQSNPSFTIRGRYDAPDPTGVQAQVPKCRPRAAAGHAQVPRVPGSDRLGVFPGRGLPVEEPGSLSRDLETGIWQAESPEARTGACETARSGRANARRVCPEGRCGAWRRAFSIRRCRCCDVRIVSSPVVCGREYALRREMLSGGMEGKVR